MIEWVFGKKKSFSDLDIPTSIQEVRRRSRILIIDDEEPALAADLRAASLSVDHVHDITKNNITIVEQEIYDLILLDYGNVGRSFGEDEGLSLLRHIKRVNPAVIIIAYTSKALKIKHSDFYRLTDGSLSKDAGIQESLEKIEGHLKKAHSIHDIWNDLLGRCNITPGSKEDLKLQDRVLRSYSKGTKKMKIIRELQEFSESEDGKKAIYALIAKSIQLITSSMGVN